jgi:hypothetical protein
MPVPIALQKELESEKGSATVFQASLNCGFLKGG